MERLSRRGLFWWLLSKRVIAWLPSFSVSTSSKYSWYLRVFAKLGLYEYRYLTYVKIGLMYENIKQIVSTVVNKLPIVIEMTISSHSRSYYKRQIVTQANVDLLSTTMSSYVALAEDENSFNSLTSLSSSSS